MPNARRRLAALATGAVLAAGLGIVPAHASGPVVIDAHDSHIPTAAFEISSSPNGTVYSADIGGFGHMYIAPAAMAVGSTTTDLGKRQYHRVGATIVGDRVVHPYAPVYGADTYNDPVTAVKHCRVAFSCPTESTQAMPAGYEYVGNAGDSAIVWNPTTDVVAALPWGGSVTVTYAVPDYSERPRVSADSTGIALSGDGSVTYINRSTAAVTAVGDGDGAVLTPSNIVWHLVGVGTDPYYTLIQRALRVSPASTTTVATLSDAPGIEELAANDTGVAWLTPNGDEDGSQALWSMVYGSPQAKYSRRLIGSGLSTFENSANFVVNDRLAGIPGFYKVAPGAYSGTLTGLVPIRPSITRGLAVSTGRAVYSDDTTDQTPVYVRDIGNGGVPGPESSVSDGSLSVGLSGPYVAYSRASTTSPGQTDVFSGRLGTTLAKRTYPQSEVGRVAVSGQRVLVTGGTRTRVIDMLTGGVTDLGHTFAALFGEWVSTINYDTGLVQRRNLLTGVVQTVRAAVPGCTTFCVDDDNWQLSAWGSEVVYAFGYGGTSPGYATGKYDGVTGATMALPMLFDAGEPDAWELVYWNGLLLVSHSHDVTVRLHDLRSGSPVTSVVATFAEEPLGLDGTMVAWRPDDDLRATVQDVDELVGGYTPEPRFLGGAIPAGFGPGAPTSLWKPSFLLSQDMTGTLDLHSGSATGPVVRSIPVASDHGEVTPTWDGEDGADNPLPQGTYYWTLTRSAAAPVTVKTANGNVTASGAVYLSTTPLGAPTLTAPTLSTDVTASTTFPISWSLPGAPAGTRYNVVRSINGGAYAAFVNGTSATTASVAGTPGTTYRFRVTSVDPSGRLGGTSGIDSTIVPFDDNATGTVYTGSWPGASSGSLYRGSHHQSGVAGATYSFKATGTEIYLVGIKASSYGQFQVSIDGGAYSGLIDAYRSTTAYRQVLYSRGRLANTAHTVKVRVYGTARRPTVGIDGVGFLR